MRAYGRLLVGLFVVSSVASACGGVNKGRVNIVEEADGGDGSGGKNGVPNGGKPSGGKANGGSAGTDAVLGGADQGESGEGPVPVLPDPPVVVSVSPADGDANAEPTDSIVIEFSEGLEPNTVTTDSVIVYAGEEKVGGTLEYSGVTATFVPDERLDLLAQYSVVVTTAVQDAGGTALAEDFSSSFAVRDGMWTEQLVMENPLGRLSNSLVSPVVDAHGNALVVWGQAKDDESVASVFGRYYTPGQGFGDSFEIDTATVGCDDISVAMNEDGEAVVAWTENHSNLEQVWARRLSGGELGATPVRIDAVAVTQVARTISAITRGGEAHVLWSFNDSNSGTQRLLTNHAVPSMDWLSTPDIIDGYESLSPPGLAFDKSGNGFIFYAFDPDSTDQEPSQLYGRRYLAATQQWGNGAIIAGSEGVPLYYAPSVVTNDKGGAAALVVAGNDVKWVTFSRAQGFGEAAAIDSLDSSPQPLPQLSSNGTKLLATWYQSASLNVNAYSAVSDGKTFEAPELRSSGDFRVGYYGTAASGMDPHGNGLTLFEQGNAEGTVDIVYGRLVNETAEWNEAARINTVAGNYQDPRVAVASNGVAVAAWSVGIRLSANSICVSTFE